MNANSTIDTSTQRLSSMKSPTTARMGVTQLTIHVLLSALVPWVLSQALVLYAPPAWLSTLKSAPPFLSTDDDKDKAFASVPNVTQKDEATTAADTPTPPGHHFLLEIPMDPSSSFMFSETQIEDLLTEILTYDSDDEDDEDDVDLVDIKCQGSSKNQRCFAFLSMEQDEEEDSASLATLALYKDPTVVTLNLFFHQPNDEDDDDDDDEEGSHTCEWVVPLLEEFLTSASSSSTKVTLETWMHLKRGPSVVGAFSVDSGANPESAEWDGFLASDQRSKSNIITKSTQFQSVTVATMPHSRQSSTGPILPSNKRMFMDGVSQSSLQGLEAYHEALVHPALLAHPTPKRVAIIGGGEGATLREVLKHKSVETCTMVEIDAELVRDVAVKHLQEWNDCSDFAYNSNASLEENGYFSCFDDPRADLRTVNAVEWFMDRFGAEKTIDEEKYDIIIMDALDPSSLVSFSDVLYGYDPFVESLIKALTSEGIFVAQVGAASFLDDDPTLDKADSVLLQFEKRLEKFGAISMTSYTESHGEFTMPWAFNVAFMGYESMANWHMEEAMVNLVLGGRAVTTKSGEFPFKYVDGGTVMDYQYPSRIEETLYCLQEPKPQPCIDHPVRGYNPDIPNIPATELEMRPSTIPNAGRGVFYKSDFKEGSYFTIEDGVHGMLIMPQVAEVLFSLHDHYPQKWRKLDNYIHGYGYPDDYLGMESHIVDPGITTFANHGCNGTNNIGMDLGGITELSLDPNGPMPEPLSAPASATVFHNPIAERNYIAWASTSDKTLRDVRAGEEVLDNYLAFENEEDWKEHLTELQASCLGQAAGLVVQVEASKMEQHPKTHEEL